MLEHGCGRHGALQLLEADGGWIARRHAGVRVARRPRVPHLARVVRGRISRPSNRGSCRLVETATGLGRMLSDATSDALIRTRIETDSDAWRQEAIRVVDLFTTTRLSREREIAERSSTAEPPTQGGLFDRRADRARQARAAALVESQQAMFDRRRSVEGAGAIALRPAQLLLAIVP